MIDTTIKNGPKVFKNDENPGGKPNDSRKGLELSSMKYIAKRIIPATINRTLREEFLKFLSSHLTWQKRWLMEAKSLTKTLILFVKFSIPVRYPQHNSGGAGLTECRLGIQSFLQVFSSVSVLECPPCKWNPCSYWNFYSSFPYLLA
jgi:hypothetical protein